MGSARGSRAFEGGGRPINELLPPHERATCKSRWHRSQFWGRCTCAGGALCSSPILLWAPNPHTHPCTQLAVPPPPPHPHPHPTPTPTTTHARAPPHVRTRPRTHCQSPPPGSPLGRQVRAEGVLQQHRGLDRRAEAPPKAAPQTLTTAPPTPNPCSPLGPQARAEGLLQQHRGLDGRAPRAAAGAARLLQVV